MLKGELLLLGPDNFSAQNIPHAGQYVCANQPKDLLHNYDHTAAGLLGRRAAARSVNLQADESHRPVALLHPGAHYVLQLQHRRGHLGGTRHHLLPGYDPCERPLPRVTVDQDIPDDALWLQEAQESRQELMDEVGLEFDFKNYNLEELARLLFKKYFFTITNNMHI